MLKLDCARIVTMLGLVAGYVLGRPASAESFAPVPANELQMTSEPQAPGAPAVFLYRQVDRDDSNGIEYHYERIKILTDAGRKYGDVEIYYNKSHEHVQGIEARVVSPSGAATPFDGTVYDKAVVEGHGIDVAARSLSLPGVQVGSIIEYRYELRLTPGYIYNSQWILSQDLFTEHAKFSFIPYPYLSMRSSWPRGLPPGTSDPMRTTGNSFHLETQNVPAVAREDFAPPENEMKYRVDFIYQPQNNREKDADPFWREVGYENFRRLDDFADKPKIMAQAVAQVVAAQDSPETKLRKLYARVQQMANTTWMPPSTEEESKRQDATPIRNVEDVWQRGRGEQEQLNMLFVALARAAGIPADPALVPLRDRTFFDPRLMNQWQLEDTIVIVTLDGKDLFLDPGMPYTAFGELDWNKTMVNALRLDKHGGQWVKTPLPAASESLVERHANLRLSSDDLLQGTITVRYTGQEALLRRSRERQEDDTARRQFLERDLQYSIPVGSNVKLTNNPDWQSVDNPLIAEFTLSIPGWFTPAGRRALFPIGLFGNAEKPIFTDSTRSQPLYFSYPYRHVDDIAIEVPAGWSINSLPGARNADLKGVAFTSIAGGGDQTMHLRRELTVNVTLVAPTNYDALRKFFEMVRSTDEEQAVLSPTSGAARQ